MDRKDFIRKGILGTGFIASNAAFGNLIQNNIDELKELEIMGFNHLPPTPSHIADNMVIHKANSRGYANHGWLDTHHSFSFANYYNPERMHFGVLRVLNDDIVDAGMGFGTHPHDNMEIISIPLSGDLEHKDSMGNIQMIKENDIQVMSAGTGIFHSEYNKNTDKKVNFLQIWLFPNKKDVTPRYDQISLVASKTKNNFQQIASPNPNDEGVWIQQNAWLQLGKFEQDSNITYPIQRKGNGAYVFVIDGSAEIENQILNKKDALGVWNVDDLQIKAKAKSQILILDVPMSL